MKLRKLLAIDCPEIAMSTGIVVRLRPKDRSREDHISMDYDPNDCHYHVDYVDGDKVSIYRERIGEFMDELEKYLDIDDEDWTVCDFTVSFLEDHIKGVQKFIDLVRKDNA